MSYIGLEFFLTIFMKRIIIDITMVILEMHG